jgi:Holliday junction DNA helicase RuvA
MFEFLRGIIADKTTSTLVLDVNGVGYFLNIPLSTAEVLGDKGAQAHVLVHFHVREDIQRLFGFATSSEREAFRQLIGISQIGPKVAMSVLSGISARDLAYAVAAGDSSKLKSISGVGPKTAQRLVVELKGKLAFDKFDIDPVNLADTGHGKTSFASVDREAFDAMIALGYSDNQVMRSLSRVKETVEADAPVEEWIRRALQVI